MIGNVGGGAAAIQSSLAFFWWWRSESLIESLLARHLGECQFVFILRVSPMQSLRKTKVGAGFEFHVQVVVASLLVVAASCVAGQSLDTNFYKFRCSSFEPISATTVAKHLQQDPSSAAALARMFFHDCFVQGCDASVLLDTTANSTAEKEAAPNVSLRQFNILEEIKSQVEAMCPGVVSCADIVAVAARDAVAQSGGPTWAVELGRRDGRTTSDVMASTHLPSSRSSAQPLMDSFAAVGLSVRDLVTLSGAHTFGRSHCTQVARRFYGFNNSSGIDPTLDFSYAQRLRTLCPQPLDARARVALDPITPNTFDTLYFQGLLMNLGMFSSDAALVLDNRTKVFVEEYATNAASFVQQFPFAMVRLGRVGVLTGTKGEIRRRCNVAN